MFSHPHLSLHKLSLIALAILLLSAVAIAEDCRLPDNWQELAAKYRQQPITKKQLEGMKSIQVPGGPTFNLLFKDLDGHPNGAVGFADPTHGATRRQVAEEVCRYLSGVLDHPGGVCDVTFEFSELDNSGALAFAFTYYEALNGFFPGFSHRRIVTDPTDPSVEFPDISVTVDFGYVWNSTTNPVSPGLRDLYSVLLHEMTHGLGFTSLTLPNGTSSVAQRAPGAKTFTTFDDLVYQAEPLVKVWDANQEIQVLPALNSGSATSLFFNGTQAKTTLGTLPYLYSPASFFPGSSVVHWSDSNTISPQAMMKRSFIAGTQRRVFQPFELAALRDLGYSIRKPPQTFWMLE